MYPRNLSPDKCQRVVPTKGLRMNYHQCRGKLWKDGWCKCHHPETEKAKNDEATRKWNEKCANDPRNLLIKEKEAHRALRESVRRLVGEWKLTSEALKNVGAEITHTTYERLIGELSALIDGKGDHP